MLFWHLSVTWGKNRGTDGPKWKLIVSSPMPPSVPNYSDSWNQCDFTREKKKKGDIEEWEIVLQLSIFGKAIYLSDAITLTTKKQYQSNISSIRNWFPLLKSDLCWLTTVTVQLTNSLHTNAYMEALLKNEFEWQLKSTT